MGLMWLKHEQKQNDREREEDGWKGKHGQSISMTKQLRWEQRVLKLREVKQSRSRIKKKKKKKKKKHRVKNGGEVDKMEEGVGEETVDYIITFLFNSTVILLFVHTSTWTQVHTVVSHMGISLSNALTQRATVTQTGLTEGLFQF